VVLRQMELLAGPERFRDGLRTYLKRFSYANATWPQLAEILGMEEFSRHWVYTAGRPTITVEGRAIRQDGDWPQMLQVLAGDRRIPITLGREVQIADAPFVLPDVSGLGYARFVLDEKSSRHLQQHLPTDARARAILFEIFWDALMERQMKPQEFLDVARRALAVETNELVAHLLLDKLVELTRRYLEPPAELEMQLWDLPFRAAAFKAYRLIARNPERLERLWRRQIEWPGLTLSEEDETATALALAALGVDVLDPQAARIKNPDRLKRFEFVRRFRDPDFFDSLRNVENRRREPWVVEALTLLHHPARDSERYILPALEMMEEIQRTGDIFFPTDWIAATLSGHGSSEAAKIVEDFLRARPNYPPRLKLKILQAADPLFRAAVKG